MAREFTLRDAVMHYNLYKRLVASHQTLIEQYEEYAHISHCPEMKKNCIQIVASQKVVQKSLLEMMKSCRMQIESASNLIQKIAGQHKENEN